MLAYTHTSSMPAILAHEAMAVRSTHSHLQASRLFSANSEIYAQGDKISHLYQVEFGAVRVYRLLADGRRQISAFHLAGESFGFEANATHHFFAEAISNTGVLTFPMSADTDISRELLPLALRGLTRAQEHLLVVGRQNAIERVAAFLIDMADRQGGLTSIDLPMTRADIGDYLGLTVETVSRIFSRLRESGHILLNGKREVEIRKRDALLDMSN